VATVDLSKPWPEVELGGRDPLDNKVLEVDVTTYPRLRAGETKNFDLGLGSRPVLLVVLRPCGCRSSRSTAPAGQARLLSPEPTSVRLVVSSCSPQ
jgi:hypothetical protein